MLRDDVKQKLLNKDCDKLFLQHRDGIDQANYRVGEIDNEIIVWNPDTNVFMDYFYDDVDEEWFELSILESNWNEYYINREGILKGPKKTLKLQKDAVWGYPQYKLRGRYRKVHVLIARLFIPNIDPDNKVVVDHINRNNENFIVSNLRWATHKENANNTYRPKYVGKHIYKAFSDINYNNLEFELNDEEAYNKYGMEGKNKLLGSFRNKHKAFNYYWVVEDLQVSEYLKSIGISKIDNSLWVEHYTGEFLVHPTGLLKFKNGTLPFLGSLSLGKSGKHPERRFHHCKKGRRVHIIIAEVFLNNNSPIKKGLVIDHINTNSLDNRSENLRICTQSENMKNPITVSKLSRKIIDSEGIVYNSISECAIKYGVSVSAIWSRLNNKRPNKGFRYYNENDQNNKQ